MVLGTPSPYPSARVEKISHGTSSIYNWYSTSVKLYVVWQSPTHIVPLTARKRTCWHLACPNSSQPTCPVSVDRQQRLGQTERALTSAYQQQVPCSGSTIREWRLLRGVWLDQTTGTTRYCGQRPNNGNPVSAWRYERASKLKNGDREDPGNSGFCRCGVLSV